MQTEKVVVITGASRRIGAVTAKLFTQNGYAVCIKSLADDIVAERLENYHLFGFLASQRYRYIKKVTNVLPKFFGVMKISIICSPDPQIRLNQVFSLYMGIEPINGPLNISLNK